VNIKSDIARLDPIIPGDYKLETTLLDENLVIDQNTFNHFAKILEHFWNQISERNYSDELTNIN